MFDFTFIYPKLIYILFFREGYESKHVWNKIEETKFIKVVVCININDIIKLVFIIETCGNLKVVIDVRELTRNINQKKTFSKPIQIFTL